MTNPTNLIQHSLALLDGNINEVFSNNLSTFLQNQMGTNSTPSPWRPSTDIIDSIGTISIYVNIAGVDPQSIDVDFLNYNLIIKGVRPPPNIALTEIINRKQDIIYGNFERQILLPLCVTQRESVTVTLKDGILSIILDKTIENRNHFNLNINDIHRIDE